MKPIALLCFLVAVVGVSMAGHGSLRAQPTKGGDLPVVQPW